MKGWAELDLEGKANVLWALAGIGVCVLVGYSVIKMSQTRKKIDKRLYLDDGDEDA